MLAAALLHDIGYHIAHESHQKHALYLIRNSELTGFSETERAVIANIARYHRDPLPKKRHTEYAALSIADRELVCKLAGIVKLADALDRSHDSRVYDLHRKVEPVLLEYSQRWGRFTIATFGSKVLVSRSGKRKKRRRTIR